MAPWNIEKTHALVSQLYGRDQEMLVRECTRFVNDRKSFCSYHFSEAMRLSRDFERRHFAESKTLLEIHLTGNDKKQTAFQRYITKAGAHATAAVQSLHAIPDIFAHAIYFCAGQNLKPDALDEERIRPPTVATCIKKDPQFADLSAPLSSLQSGAAWAHLAAVSNISKHRSVVRAMYNEDCTGTRTNKREIQIMTFERRNKRYPATSLQDLLEPEYDRLLTAIVTIGHELNASLQRLADEAAAARIGDNGDNKV